MVWGGIRASCLALAIGFSPACGAFAQSGADRTEPLWEAGVGEFGVYGPDYPASARYSLNGLPVPYVIYRGDVLRVGGGSAARIVPVDTPRYEVSVSLDASFGASSSDNPLRAGLPDLDPLFELGPQLVVHGPRFNAGTPREGTLDFVLQTRGVISLSADGTGYEGTVAQAQVRYRQNGLLGPGSRITASAGPIFATEGVHDYFYQVPASAARPGRPAFDAGAGYLGTEFSLGVAVPVTERLRLFGGAALGLYHGAANANSPLFEDALTGAVFAGLAYSFAISDRRVAAR